MPLDLSAHAVFVFHKDASSQGRTHGEFVLKFPIDGARQDDDESFVFLKGDPARKNLLRRDAFRLTPQVNHETAHFLQGLSAILDSQEELRHVISRSAFILTLQKSH
jgi:hypothetical protein